MSSVTERTVESGTGSEVQTQIHYRLVETLSASERRYRALVENLRDPVFQCDLSGRLHFVNRAWVELFGATEVGAGGQYLADFAVSADLGILADALSSLRNSDESKPISGELRVQAGHGAITHVGYSFQRTSDGDLVGSFHNISEQKETEASLRRAKDAAEEASQLKSSFLANMSHEIRTPLSAVLGYAELLANDTLEDAERRDCVMRISRNGRHLLTLVSDILDFSRIESGKLDVSPEPFELGEFVDELVREHSEAARKKGLRIVVDWSRKSPRGDLFVADRVRLKQILANLLSNAVKFTFDGSVTLTIRTDAGARVVCFSVQDTGIGIPPEKLATVFEPFRQADETIVRRFGGTGLGLAIADHLASLLGGRLTAESRLEQGSRFSLELPLRTAEAAGASAESGRQRHDRRFASIHSASSGKGRLLVVEDTPDLRRLIVRFTEGLGLSVETVSNGAEALTQVADAAASEHPYKAILMDMQMPVLDGYSATRRLREQGYEGLIIAMTAHAMPADREKCLAAGCDDYIAKPLTRMGIRTSLERALESNGYVPAERGGTPRWG